MTTVAFQKLLLQSAVFSMGVDGSIHENELEELKRMVAHTAYFLDFEYEELLQENVALLSNQGKEAFQAFLSQLSSTELSEKQELILLEVIFRIIDADKEVHQNELQFLHMVKARLKAAEEVLLMNFPKHIEYLLDFKGDGLKESFDLEVILK